MITIVDYGMGNLGSIRNMLSRIGAECRISADPGDVLTAEKLILPGVGHFDRAMRNLRESGLFEALNEAVMDQAKPVLGICLGQHLLTRGSEEGDAEGFGWIDAEVGRFRFPGGQARQVPHMGWNRVEVRGPSPILDDRYADSRFYFVHSYRVTCDREANVLARTRYGETFDSAIRRDHILGVQFHPEKSHKHGFRLLAKYAAWAPDGGPARQVNSSLISRTDVSDAPASQEAQNGVDPADEAVRVIPVLQLRGSGLVKTRQFKDPKYVGDPRNAVKIFNEKEVDELAILDIEATVQGREPNYALLEEIISEAFMPIAYGGAISSIDQARRLLAMGVEKILLNTAACEKPDLVREASEHFGAQSVVAVLDVKRAGLLKKKNRPAYRSGSRTLDEEPADFARRLADLGAGEILLQSINRDGTQHGYDLDLIRSVANAVDVPVIACGGAGSLEHLAEAIDRGGASAVAAGSLFVFQGRHRAVLINYPRPEKLRAVLGRSTEVPDGIR